MLPTTTADAKDWKPETLSVFQGLRGILILWVFWQHVSSRSPGDESIMHNTQGASNQMQFNTASFLIISGFAAHIQTRNQPMKYFQWCLSKWFGLIPLACLCLILDLPQISSAPLQNLSPGSQVYLVVMQFAGFGWVGQSGNFGYLQNATAWGYGSDFGDVGFALGFGGNFYFASLLFMSLLLFALMHYVLTFQLPRRMFQGFGGLGAALCAIAMIAASLVLGYATTPIPAEDFWNYWHVTGSMSVTNGNCNFLAPMVLLGVCVAELRYHLSATMRAVLGHWLVVDACIIAFTILTFTPHPNTQDYGTNAQYDACQRQAELCTVSPLDTPAEIAAMYQQEACFRKNIVPGCPALAQSAITMCMMSKDVISEIQTSLPKLNCSDSAAWQSALQSPGMIDLAAGPASVTKSAIISAAQFVLFCLVLICLSCQAHHKKRSLIVFGIFERSIFSDFFGKYSYVFYLFPQVIINGSYLTAWLCLGKGAECRIKHTTNWGELTRLLVLILGIALGLVAQWWQETYVNEAHLSLLSFLRSSWGEEMLMSERNPLSGLVVWCRNWGKEPTGDHATDEHETSEAPHTRA